MRYRLALATWVVTLILPASAAASDTYVNQQTGSDGNPCTSPSAPCATIQAGVAAAGTGDTIFVQAPSGGPATYGGELSVLPITLGDGKSLVSQAPDPSQTLITNSPLSTSAPAVNIASDAGTISGFTFQSYTSSISTSYDVTVEHDRFNQVALAGTASNPRPVVSITGGSPSFRDDTFVDTNPTDQNTGMTAIKLDTGLGSAVEVSNSSFSGFHEGVVDVPVNATGGGTLTISGDSINLDDRDPGPTVGIDLSDGTATITGSSMTMTHFAGGSGSWGVRLQEGTNPATTGATLSRDYLFDLGTGVFVEDTGGSVSLDNDLIGDSPTSLWMQDTGTGGGDVTATNITAWPGVVATYGTHFTVDSSILTTVSGTGACTISYTRGDEFTGPAACHEFQTTADPGFVDPTGDFHLSASSPLIDAGNPVAPGPGAQDLDGNSRALSAIPSCTAPDPGRRDMGAYEYVPAPTDCPTPTPQPTPTPPQTQGGGTSGTGAAAKRRCKRKFRHNTKARKKCLKKARRRR